MTQKVNILSPVVTSNRNNRKSNSYILKRDYLELFIEDIEILDNSKRMYQKSISHFFQYLDENHIPYNAIDRNTIRDFRRSLEEKQLEVTTRRNYLTTLKIFFTWLATRDLYPNIAQGIKTGKVSRFPKKQYLTFEQTLKLLNSIDTSTIVGKRNKAMISLMAICGLRTIEVSRASIGSLESRENKLFLHVQRKGKLDEVAFVRIPFPLKLILEEYLQTRGSVRQRDPLFINYAANHLGKRLDTQSISKITKRALTNAGFIGKRYTAHSLRHSAATNAILAGATLEEVSQMLGHASLETTMIYNHALKMENNTAEDRISRELFPELYNTSE